MLIELLLATFAAALFGFSFVAWTRQHGIHPIRAAVAFFPRSRCEALVLLAVVFGAMHYAASKGDGGQLQSPSSPVAMTMAMPQVPTVLPASVNPLDMNFPTNFPPVTNLCFWGIERSSNAVSIGATWPFPTSFTNGLIDLYGSWNLASNGWQRLLQIDVGVAVSNAVVDVPFSLFPTNAMEETVFFRLASQDDADADGLSDAYEAWSTGTDPSVADTDGDGLGDGDELDAGTDPMLSDTDGDGLSDGEEYGSVKVLPASETSWLGMYGPVNVWSTSTVTDQGSFLVNLPYPYVVNGTVYSQIRICTDGVAYLVDPEYPNWSFTSVHHSPPSLASYEMSQRHVAVAWFCSDLYIKARPWGSWCVCGYRSMPSGYATVIDLYSIGFASDVYSSDPHLFSCQIVLPSGEPNVMYLTYDPMTPSSYFANLNPTIGVQSPWLPPMRPGESYYNLTWVPSSDSFSARRKIKITIGTGTSPISPDTDGDGFSDHDETDLFHTDPFEPDDDTDLDGLPDEVELRIGTSLDGGDTDGDGLGDLDEFVIGTNPIQPDTDGDGMNDGWEHRHAAAGFDPTVDNATDANPNNNIGADPDNDGLTNGQECEWGTNPSGLDLDGDGHPDGYDTDGDGVSDGAEVAQNSDPTDTGDGGAPNTRIPLSFYFGDPSASHSEKYRLAVTPTVGAGAAPASFSWLNENYGECETKTAMLKPGWKYEVRLYHAGTNISGGSPDYDYELTCGNGSLPSSVVVQDPDGLFGTDETSTSFGGAGKVAYVYVLAPPLISAPSVVGVNNDDDNGNGTPDCEDDGTVVGDDDLGEITVSVWCPQGFSGTVEVTSLVGATVGTLWRDADRVQSLDATESFVVPSSGTTRTYFAEGCNPSSHHEAEGIRAVFRCGNATLTNEFRFTFVERVAEPITTERSGGQIVNPCCAVIGGTTKLKVEVLPNDFPESKVNWRVVSGLGSFSDATGREAEFVASGAEGEEVVVQVDVGDCPGRAPQFTMLTTAMHEVKIYTCAITKEDEDPPITSSQIIAMLDEVNVIYRQVGLHFSLGASLMCVTNDVWAQKGLVISNVSAQIRNIMSGTDGIEVYFIEGDGNFEKEPLGKHNSHGIIVRKPYSAVAIAHEIGHACGWGDIYYSRNNNIPTVMYEGLQSARMLQDWNNGTGCRFYNMMLTQSDIISRLLMHGVNSGGQSDIPLGNVFGLPKNGDVGVISVGRTGVFVISPRSN